MINMDIRGENARGGAAEFLCPGIEVSAPGEGGRQ
jgi:hypothetical protein